jgi:flagellar hook-associated protein FlgK
MGVIANMLKAQLEELKRQDEELQRDIQDTIKRCNILLDNLTKLDDE